MTVAAPWMPSSQFVNDRYALESELGRGGFGSVWSAFDQVLNRRVAIKFLLPGIGRDHTMRARFCDERRLQAQVRHPNIVAALDAGETDDGVMFLVMELAEGATLATFLDREGRLPWQQAGEWMRQILCALVALHEEGIVLRDIKPHNMIVSTHRRRETVKLFDFGIARPLDRNATRAQVTAEGFILGSPRYMAPEQIRNEELDTRADLYAASVVLYEMLAGHPPFVEPGNAVLVQHLIARPDTLPLGCEVPRAIEALVMRGLSKDPADRFLDAAEMQAALEAAMAEGSSLAWLQAHAKPALGQPWGAGGAGDPAPGDAASNAASNAASDAASDAASEWAFNGSPGEAPRRGRRFSLRAALMVALIAATAMAALLLILRVGEPSPALVGEPSPAPVDEKLTAPAPGEHAKSASGAAELQALTMTAPTKRVGRADSPTGKKKSAPRREPSPKTPKRHSDAKVDAARNQMVKRFQSALAACNCTDARTALRELVSQSNGDLDSLDGEFQNTCFAENRCSRLN